MAKPKTKRRCGVAYRHNRPTACRNPETRARVLAACLELIGELGRMPGSEMIAKRARVSHTDAIDARTLLVHEGALPASLIEASGWFRKALDDPTAEQPDDPDADEIRARIAEARAAKEASGGRVNRFVMRARHHLPDRCGRRRYAM